MADSNITKRALAAALKALMEELPFDKINVAQICERCDMNRKSFYYHFKDKYDLVNWIFDTEFLPIALSQNSRNNDREEFIMSVCEYFYANRSFYRKALQIKGAELFFRPFARVLCADPARSVRISLRRGYFRRFYPRFLYRRSDVRH